MAFDPKTGFITVDDQLRTNVPNIFAVGDVARPPMLAHKAYREGVVAAEAIAGRPTRFQFQAMPSVVFTDPELASVGFAKAEAEAQGYTVREARFPYAALGRAHASHATQGWLKVVGDDATGLLLGVHAGGRVRRGVHRRGRPRDRDGGDGPGPGAHHPPAPHVLRDAPGGRAPLARGADARCPEAHRCRRG